MTPESITFQNVEQLTVSKTSSRVIHLSLDSAKFTLRLIGRSTGDKRTKYVIEYHDQGNWRYVQDVLEAPESAVISAHAYQDAIFVTNPPCYLAYLIYYDEGHLLMETMSMPKECVLYAGRSGDVDGFLHWNGKMEFRNRNCVSNLSPCRFMEKLGKKIQITRVTATHGLHVYKKDDRTFIVESFQFGQGVPHGVMEFEYEHWPINVLASGDTVWLVIGTDIIGYSLETLLVMRRPSNLPSEAHNEIHHVAVDQATGEARISVRSLSDGDISIYTTTMDASQMAIKTAEPGHNFVEI